MSRPAATHVLILIPTLLGGFFILLQGQGAPNRTGLDWPIVVTQVPRGQRLPSGTEPGRGAADWFGFEGARLLMVSPDGESRVLTPGFDSACDPAISFEGRQLLFAGRRDRTSAWRIWEMGLDGQDPCPITPGHFDARSPIYVSTLFTLDSPEPWFTAVFVGREHLLNEMGQPTVSSLYSIKLDGTQPRRLTFNPNRNLDPFQMWDGRVIYAAERYPNEAGDEAGRVGLYAIHIEGADMEFYGGDRGQRVQRMPCATGQGLVVFVESDDGTPDGAGQLAAIEQRRPHLTYRRLTRDPAYRFSHPSSLSDSRVLVSRRPATGRGTAGVFAFDTEKERCTPVFDRPDGDEVQAVVVAPRPRPDGHSTVVDTKFDSGLFYGLNCYDTDLRLAPYLSTGMVKRVRFIEGVPQPAGPASDCGVRGPPVARRLIGEAPVETDGSFNVEVPADTPMLLQALDEHGLALANCGWIWVKPKEKRGCIGCHEDPERVPENEYVLALRRPSNRLVLPPQDRRALSFREDVAPLLQRHCAAGECHGGKDSPLFLPLAGSRLAESDVQAAYAALLAPAADKPSKSPPALAAGKYVDPGRARTSWLIWQVTGADRSRPWDHASPGASKKLRKVTPMPPSGKAVPLTDDEVKTLIQWIDLGAPYAGPLSTENHRGLLP